MADAPDPESPQVEQGYFKVAHTLLPGLILAPLYQEAKVILCEVVGQWLGKGRASTYRVDVKAIAERWGLHQSHVRRGLKQLKDAGILVEHGDRMTVKVGKRALMQMLPENIRKGLGSFAEDARNGESFRSTKLGTNRVPNLVQPRTKLGTESIPNLVQNRTKLGTPGGGVYKEEEVEEQKQLTQLVGVDSDSIPETISIDDPRHAAYVPDLKPSGEFIHDGPSMPANFGELTAKAEELFRGKATSFPGLLRGKRSEPEWIDWFRTIPADVWHEALRDMAAVKDSTKWNPGYFLAIVKRQWRDGKDRTRMGQANAEKPKRKETPIPPYRETVDPGFLARREKALRLRQIALGWIKPDESDAAPMEASA